MPCSVVRKTFWLDVETIAYYVGAFKITGDAKGAYIQCAMSDCPQHNNNHSLQLIVGLM